MQFLVCLIHFLGPFQDALLQRCVQLNQLFLRLLETGDLHESKDHAVDPVLHRAVGAHAQQEPAACFALHLALDGHQRAQDFLGIL